MTTRTGIKTIKRRTNICSVRHRSRGTVHRSLNVSPPCVHFFDIKSSFSSGRTEAERGLDEGTLNVKSEILWTVTLEGTMKFILRFYRILPCVTHPNRLSSRSPSQPYDSTQWPPPLFRPLIRGPRASAWSCSPHRGVDIVRASRVHGQRSRRPSKLSTRA